MVLLKMPMLSSTRLLLLSSPCQKLSSLSKAACFHGSGQLLPHGESDQGPLTLASLDPKIDAGKTNRGKNDKIKFETSSRKLKLGEVQPLGSNKFKLVATRKPLESGLGSFNAKSFSELGFANIIVRKVGRLKHSRFQLERCLRWVGDNDFLKGRSEGGQMGWGSGLGGFLGVVSYGGVTCNFGLEDTRRKVNE